MKKNENMEQFLQMINKLRTGNLQAFERKLLLSTLFVISLSTCPWHTGFAAENSQASNIDNAKKPVNVEVVHATESKKAPVTSNSVEEDVQEPSGDHELEYLNKEITKQKEQIGLNKQKTSRYKNLRKTTEKLSNVTEQYVEEKKASQEVINEYNLKIKCLLNEDDTDPDCEATNKVKTAAGDRSDKKLEAQVGASEALLNGEKAPSNNTAQNNGVNNGAPLIVQHFGQTQASPAAPKSEASVESPAPVTYPGQVSSSTLSANTLEKESKPKVAQVGIYAGVATYNGDGVNNVQANQFWGLTVETAPSREHHFMVGIGFEMHDFTTKDVTSDYITPYVNYYNNYYGYNGRVVEGKTYGANLNGKFLVMNEGPIYPYIGLGVGYHFMNLKYDNNANYSYGAQSFGGESLANSYLTGRGMLGADYRLADSFALGLEIFMERGFSSSQSQSTDPSFPDLQRLNQISQKISQANFAGFSGALKVLF